MDEYYKILELEPGASPQEIKKAYFRLIRQYTPEKDPDRFKEIREAYDQLKNREETEDVLTFPAPQDPWVIQLRKHLKECKSSGNLKLYRDACEEAVKKFPEEISFLYELMIAQRQAGNTGKAVKNAEKLVSLEPENKWFRRELAISYMERGYSQKAQTAFREAYEAGCRDNDFILTYSLACNEYDDNPEGIRILLELVRKKKKYSREQMPELIEAFTGLYAMSRQMGGTYFSEIVEELRVFVRQYAVYMEENLENVGWLVSSWSVTESNSREDNQKIDEIYFMLRRACHSEEAQNTLYEHRKRCLIERACHDGRIGEVLRTALISAFGADPMGAGLGYDRQEMELMKRFMAVDQSLCLLEEREQLKGELEVIRTDYPEFYENIRDFLEKLKNEKDIPRLKEGLLKTYRRLEPMFECGMFYERHPEEKVLSYGRRITEGEDGMPYVRPEKKIGRNDPCPCGSGRKYKQCCGR
ncbi:MAG: DnaJ domain-containing protein [Clostridiales bacterium]|nr:DnaJ domain-containing protein [Clostridiales bacterium]